MSGLSHSSELLSLSELDHSSFGQFVAIDRDDFPSPWKEEQWLESREENNYLIFPSFLEGQICCFSLFLHNASESFGHLLKVVVVRNLRRQGIAKANLIKSFELLKEIPTAKVFLEVELTNTSAIKLYETLDFEKLVEKKDFYGASRDAAAMMLEL